MLLATTVAVLSLLQPDEVDDEKENEKVSETVTESKVKNKMKVNTTAEHMCVGARVNGCVLCLTCVLL